MKFKLKKATAGIFLLALMAFVWQCTSWITSATLRLTYYTEGRIHSVDNKVEKTGVDLREHKDWQEHHEDIRSISRILFAFWVKNKSDNDAEAQFYVYTDSSLSTAAQVKNDATLVVEGVSVPANDSTFISAKNSHRYLRNLDELEDRFMEGQFWLYCIAETIPFEIEVPDSAAFVIEFTYAVDWEF